MNNSPVLSVPCIVGYMSVDVNREYHPNLTELKFVNHIPRGKLSLNLDHNLNNAVKRTTDDYEEKIDLLLKYLLDRNESIPHFVMYRRTMISVFCTAFGLEQVTIQASLFKGSIYLSNVVPPENKRLNFSEENLRMCAWGYKFEQYMAADSPHLNPDIQKPVIENAEFSLCFRAVLGSHQLLYAAQIDGLLATEGNVSDPPRHADYETNLNYLRNNKYIELKTNRELHHRRHEDSFKRHKMLKCWAQCYLANLHGLLVGYRNNSGIVQRLQYFKTDQIVEYCKDFWSPGPALEFLDYFLTFVKNTFKEYVKQTHGEHSDFKKIGPINLEFHIDNNQRIQFTDQCDKILPDWYVEAKNVNEM